MEEKLSMDVHELEHIKVEKEGIKRSDLCLRSYHELRARGAELKYRKVTGIDKEYEDWVNLRYAYHLQYLKNNCPEITESQMK